MIPTDLGVDGHLQALARTCQYDEDVFLDKALGEGLDESCGGSLGLDG